MFDIGFSEIIVCCIVALIVIGPERLPETVRTVGLWIGRLKRSLRETRGEIERQMGVDDIRRQLHNEDIMLSLESARKDINSVIEQAQANAIDPYIYPDEVELPDHAHPQTDAHAPINDPLTIGDHLALEKLQPSEKVQPIQEHKQTDAKPKRTARKTISPNAEKNTQPEENHKPS